MTCPTYFEQICDADVISAHVCTFSVRFRDKAAATLVSDLGAKADISFRLLYQALPEIFAL